MRIYVLFTSIAAFGFLAFFIGCGSQAPISQSDAPDTAPVTAPATADNSGEHEHLPGAHGGTIVQIGQDNYHAEAVFEKGGGIRLYMLGKDEAKVVDVENQTLTAYIKAEGDSASAKMLLEPDPQMGDAEGKTSLFVGTLPSELEGQSLEITIPSITIAGERFRFGFASSTSGHDTEMPAKVADEEETALYLTAGGKYTEADIEANGRMTASAKFKGFRAAHDLNPKVGEQICPVTLTKANPKCTWIIGGKTYEFCCPPCIDEFVILAKEEPAEVKEPEQYVKK